MTPTGTTSAPVLPRAVLVFSRTSGFRHASIDAGVATIQQLGREHGFAVAATEDPNAFTEKDLAHYDVVVWMQVSGVVLDEVQRRAYERFTEQGGGFVGIHAGSDAERGWPLYEALVGARFRSHPSEMQTARISVEGPTDPSTIDLPRPWHWFEEWYNFEANPRPHVEVLATVAESDYDPGPDAMGADHPVVWRTRSGSARGWYTALGHTDAAFADPVFRQHLLGGIASATPELANVSTGRSRIV